MILLDSQAALWVLDDSPRLGLLARQLISGSPAVHVSAATVWELTIKVTLGKIDIPIGLPARLADQDLALLAVSAAHAEGLRDSRSSSDTTRSTGSSWRRQQRKGCVCSPPTGYRSDWAATSSWTPAAEPARPLGWGVRDNLVDAVKNRSV